MYRPFVCKFDSKIWNPILRLLLPSGPLCPQRGHLCVSLLSAVCCASVHHIHVVISIFSCYLLSCSICLGLSGTAALPVAAWDCFFFPCLLPLRATCSVSLRALLGLYSESPGFRLGAACTPAASAFCLLLELRGTHPQGVLAFGFLPDSDFITAAWPQYTSMAKDIGELDF